MITSIALLALSAAHSGEFVCQLAEPPASPDLTVTVLVRATEATQPMRTTRAIGSGRFEVQAPEGADVVVRVQGYRPAAVTLDHLQKRCAPVELLPARLIHGTVDPAAPGTVVRSCADTVYPDKRGRFSLSIDPEAPCWFQAERMDSGLLASSDRVELPGDFEGTVDLVLPPFPAAGVGLRLRQREQGPVVFAVTRGFTAYNAGIQCGDAVVEIDGLKTEGMEPADLSRLLVGAEGSDVMLRIVPGDNADDVREVLLHRQPKEKPDPAQLCP